jgi:hypothetical protein
MHAQKEHRVGISRVTQSENVICVLVPCPATFALEVEEFVSRLAMWRV